MRIEASGQELDEALPLVTVIDGLLNDLFDPHVGVLHLLNLGLDFVRDFGKNMFGLAFQIRGPVPHLLQLNISSRVALCECLQALLDGLYVLRVVSRQPAVHQVNPSVDVVHVRFRQRPSVLFGSSLLPTSNLEARYLSRFTTSLA